MPDHNRGPGHHHGTFRAGPDVCIVPTRPLPLGVGSIPTPPVDPRASARSRGLEFGVPALDVLRPFRQS